MTRGTRLWLAGLALALLVAGVLARFASAEPDGLERVAEDHGIAGQAVEGTAVLSYDGPSSLLGLLAVLVLATGVALLLRRRRPTGSTGAQLRGR